MTAEEAPNVKLVKITGDICPNRKGPWTNEWTVHGPIKIKKYLKMYEGGINPQRKNSELLLKHNKPIIVARRNSLDVAAVLLIPNIPWPKDQYLFE